MEELRYKDPDFSPERSESGNYRSTEETRAPQPKTQSNPTGDRSDDFIPNGEWKWNDIPACEKFEAHTWESSISKLLMELVHHRDQKDRELDGAVHWKSICPELRHACQEQEGRTFFLILIGSNAIWKGSSKTRFQHCKNSHEVPLYIRASQGHTGGKVIAPELMGHVAIHSDGSNSCFTEDAP